MTDFLSGFGLTMQPQFWISVLEIIWINVLLSGDNAIVIALACRSLAPKQRLAGMVFGTVTALVLRLVFASIVLTLMSIPYVKIVGGVALLWIAMKLLMPDEEPDKPAAPSHSLMRAIMVIAVADIVMSLDNVIAVAAAAHGNFALLVFGLGISVPAIVGGATVISTALTYFPILIWAGAALLGWIAGELIATDPMVVESATALGPAVYEKFKVTCAVVGVATTLLAGYVGRARQARHV
jgi:YjbE family integral membrane protein